MGKKSKAGSVAKSPSRKKIWSTKEVLASPFAPTMPAPITGTAPALTAMLKRNFASPPLQREPRRSKKLPPDASPAAANGAPRKPAGLIIGINEVTKGLEQDKLALVVLARDVLPSIVVSHIPVLCFTQKAKLVLVPGDGSAIGAAFGMRRMLAFAIAKTTVGATGEFPVANRIFDGAVKFAVEIDYPWLAAAKGKGPLPTLPASKMQPHTAIKKQLEKP